MSLELISPELGDIGADRVERGGWVKVGTGGVPGGSWSSGNCRDSPSRGINALSSLRPNLCDYRGFIYVSKLCINMYVIGDFVCN